MENGNYTNSLINKSFLDRHSLNKYRLYTSRGSTTILIILSVIIFVMVFINLISANLSRTTLFSVIFILLVIFYITNILVLSEKAFFNIYKSCSLSYEFSFSEKNVKADVFSQITTSYNICQYQYFTKLVERDDFFYLYINLRNAYIIDKKGFVNGTIEDFKQLMANVYAAKSNKV